MPCSVQAHDLDVLLAHLWHSLPPPVPASISEHIEHTFFEVVSRAYMHLPDNRTDSLACEEGRPACDANALAHSLVTYVCPQILVHGENAGLLANGSLAVWS